MAYPVPASAPTGEVDVLSLGVAELPVASLIGSDRFVHMRVAAFNREDTSDWILDAREQMLDLPDGKTLSPRYATSSAGPAAPPRLTLHGRERGYLDLFFALRGDQVRWLSLTWRIRRETSSELILATTVFEPLPAYDDEYAHLRPSQYLGAVLWLGPSWCEPRWSSNHWFSRYSHHQRYRYARRPDGFDVTDGDTRWIYRQQSARLTPETVGSHWRGRASTETAAHAQTALAMPAAATRASPELAEPRSVRAWPAPATVVATARTAAAGLGWRLKVEPITSAAPASMAPTIGGFWRSPSSVAWPSERPPSSSPSGASAPQGGSHNSGGGSVGSHWRR